MAPLSRVQLAAALIEYDNDDPYAEEPRYARESAILANVKPSGPPRRRQRTRPPSAAYVDDDEDAEADGPPPARPRWPRPSVGKASDRRSWITVQEPHMVAERPDSPPDFRRSHSPFMKELSEATPPSVTASARPDAPELVDPTLPPLSARTFASEQTSSPVALHNPGSAPATALSPAASAAPLAAAAGQRPRLSAPVPTKAATAPFVLPSDASGASPSGQSPSPSTLLPPPERTPSDQALKSYAPLSPSPLGAISLRDPSTASRSASFTSIPLQPPSRSSSVPLELQLRDQSMSLFAVPFFETPLPPAPARKRSKSPFRFLSPKTSPAASQALLPDELALRDAIAALPRSLGGDPPSGDHRRGMGPRARTGSMGDWEDLVFQAHDGFKTDAPLSNFRSFGSRSAAASQVFFEDDVSEAGLVGAGSGVLYGPDGTIGKKPRAKSMDMLSVGGGAPGFRRAGSGLSEVTTNPLFEIPDFDQQQPASAPAETTAHPQLLPSPRSPEMMLPYAAAVPTVVDPSNPASSVGDSPVVIQHPLPISPRAQEAERISWETVARPLADLEGLAGSAPISEDSHRRTSNASSFDIISTSRLGKTPPATAAELVEPPDTPVAPLRPISRTSLETKTIDRPRRSNLLLGSIDLGESVTPATDTPPSGSEPPSTRPESTVSLLDEIGRTTPGLLTDAELGRSSIDQVRRSLQLSRLSRNAEKGVDANDDGEDVEYLAQDEREKWLPPPTKNRTSRFDPANARPRTTSFHGVPEEADDDDDQPADGRRRPGKPKSAARLTSLAHFKESGRLATTATSSIFLPPVLVMPAPLDPAAYEDGQQAANSRGFFETAAKPLPADFKSRPPINHSRSSSSFIASAAALAIPDKRLTLAQKTFRASLVVDGKRGNEFLGGALEEGDRAFEEGDDDSSNHWHVRPEDEYRGPGTLYGRSLMDTLEQRKQEMASKKRTFRGDNRPSMFTRSATEAIFTSAPSVRGRPQSVHLNPTFPAGEGDAASLRAPGMSQRASVFGLDKHWQEAMAEREAEDQELAEAERRREEAATAAHEAAEAKRISKLKGKKRMSSKLSVQSGLADEAEQDPSPPAADSPTRFNEFGVAAYSPVQTRASKLPPSLSLGDLHGSAPIENLYSDDERDDARDAQPSPSRTAGRTDHRSSRVVSRAGWESSDDEDRPKKARAPSTKSAAASQLPRILATTDDTSSEEDVPLAAHYNLPSLRTTARPSSFLYQPSGPAAGDSSDEEVPLSQLVAKDRDGGASVHTRGPAVPRSPLKPDQTTRSPTKPTAAARDDDNDDDDDVPLGVRQSTIQPQHPDEDDVPLGLSQAQHLQQQYYQQQAAAAQQAQLFLMQQQAMQQQAMQQRMMMASMMGGSTYGVPGFGQIQPPAQGHPPTDEKIARWREEVPTE